MIQDDDPIFVIQSDDDHTDFWSNEEGWVDFGTCSIFKEDDTEKLRLPDGGSWVKVWFMTWSESEREAREMLEYPLFKDPQADLDRFDALAIADDLEEQALSQAWIFHPDLVEIARNLLEEARERRREEEELGELEDHFDAYRPLLINGHPVTR